MQISAIKQKHTCIYKFKKEPCIAALKLALEKDPSILEFLPKNWFDIEGL